MDTRWIAVKAQYYGLTNGILVEERSNASAASRDRGQLRPTIPSIALFPSPLPRRELEYIRNIQPLINELYDNVSRDYAFIRKALERVIETDEFTSQLVNILEIVEREQLYKNKTTTFGLIRSDYMRESRPEACSSLTAMKQTEVNTVAASTACVAERIPQFHRFTVTLRDGFRPDNYNPELPTPSNGKGLAEGLVSAWKQYNSERSVIVMIVGEGEWNTYDMFHLETLLLQSYGVKVVQVIFDDVIKGGPKEAKLREDGALIIDGHEVAITYFRFGYSPEHYPSQKYWDVRLLFERSRSIQCPSVALHLAGTKKVQQELATPGALERFLSNRDAVEKVQAVFLKMYALDQTPEGDKAAASAIADPFNYIMKPQREGGGSNLYNEDIKKTLIDLKDSVARSSYTIQDRIYPVENTNVFLKPGRLDELKQLKVVEEIGIFGTYVRTDDKFVTNSVPGHYMRVKESDMGEGCMLLGYAAIGSPWLY
ncbi:glutathione synthetase-like [Corticium candelabrum]|uniref:glutathione synthetase-like n=1 Tax=Corticium candelabrum TaxID=121492 RepID=UPI002E25CDC6|nr:glutathione synthetase-like [Corticium candelabrum]